MQDQFFLSESYPEQSVSSQAQDANRQQQSFSNI
jgi:hypothetical protein